MNSRRVHQFMREHFPTLGTAEKTWTNVADVDGPRLAEIGLLLFEYVGPSETIVEVHRKLGALLPAEDATSFIGSHIGKGEIRATNRQCSGFVVVAVNGVAWAGMPDNRGAVRVKSCSDTPSFTRLRPQSVAGS